MAENYIGKAPRGYKWVDCVENPSNAYIKTGLTMNQIGRVECEMMLNQNTGNNYNHFFGNGSNGVNVLYNNRITCYWNGKYAIDFVSPYQRMTILWEAGHFKINGIEKRTSNSAPLTDAGNLCIFNTSNPSNNHRCLATAWWFKVYGTDGVLLRYYLPIQRLSDEKYGLWDKVNQTFNVSPNGVNFVWGGGKYLSINDLCRFFGERRAA